MKEIIAIDIILDTETVDFFGPANETSPQQLKGKIRVLLNKPLKLKYVVLKLNGTNRFLPTSLGTLHHQYSNIPEEVSVTTVYNTIQCLPAPRVLAQGVTDFPFEMQLAGDSPPSFENAMGYLQYKLTAVIAPAALLGKSERFRKTFPVRRFTVPGFRTLSLAKQRTLYEGKREGVVKYRFDVAKIVCVEQGSVAFSGIMWPINGHELPTEVTVLLEEVGVC
ncbi:hypothetical protein BC938DRAFT_483413, partial [Jimgerdemannia flammicorona]